MYKDCSTKTCFFIFTSWHCLILCEIIIGNIWGMSINVYSSTLIGNIVFEEYVVGKYVDVSFNIYSTTVCSVVTFKIWTVYISVVTVNESTSTVNCNVVYETAVNDFCIWTVNIDTSTICSIVVYKFSVIFYYSMVTYNKYTTTVMSSVISESSIWDSCIISFDVNTSTSRCCIVVMEIGITDFTIITHQIDSTILTVMVIELRTNDSGILTFNVDCSTTSINCSVVVKCGIYDICMITIHINSTCITCRASIEDRISTVRTGLTFSFCNIVIKGTINNSNIITLSINT